MRKESLVVARESSHASSPVGQPGFNSRRKLRLAAYGLAFFGFVGLTMTAGNVHMGKVWPLGSHATTYPLPPANRVPPAGRKPAAVVETAQAVPHWVAAGIVQLTHQLHRETLVAKHDQSALVAARSQAAKYQLTIGNLQQQEHTLQTQVLQLRMRMQQIQMRSRAPSAVSLPGHSQVARTGQSGIVALQAQSTPVPKKARVVPSVARKWLAIAVHDGKAVIQTPSGQVVMVHVGSIVDGTKITAINPQKQSVQISGNRWMYLPK
ncbi:hypothetical protein [Acidithiobacillus caldus]|uniref:hypothetical protein n=2 Tax=Acidithiobacillus caldus TaxID=33059 RepID=UPI00114D0FF5|nr:hypothetical protein [Acidithiobacillus caldus]